MPLKKCVLIGPLLLLEELIGGGAIMVSWSPSMISTSSGMPSSTFANTAPDKTRALTPKAICFLSIYINPLTLFLLILITTQPTISIALYLTGPINTATQSINTKINVSTNKSNSKPRHEKQLNY
jgi:hypothetical protein